MQSVSKFYSVHTHTHKHTNQGTTWPQTSVVTKVDSSDVNIRKAELVGAIG